MHAKLQAVAAVILGASASVGIARADDISDAVAKLDARREEVAPAARDLLVSGADIQVAIPYAPLVTAVTGFNRLGQPARTVTVRSVGAPKGHLWEDPAWCNSYAEVQGPGALTGEAILSRFAASTRPDGGIALAVHLDVNIEAQLRWNFMGRRMTLPFGGGSGACPPGGGFGGSIGATGKTASDLAALISLSQDRDTGSLDYVVDLTAPSSSSITLSFGLPGIGKVGIPMSVPLPLGRLTAGKVPLVFNQAGQFDLPGGGVRTYDARLRPSGFTTDGTQAVASWTSQVTFR